MSIDRNHLYEATIRRMVTQALGEKEERFAVEHCADSDEQLFGYLRRCAAELGHSPQPREIVGWMTILERYGDWHWALEKAALPPPRTQEQTYQLELDEIERQKKLYREKKARKKAKRAR